MPGTAVRHLSALLTKSPPDPSASPTGKVGYAGDFLKLDNDVSIGRDRIEIGTVLYDRHSSPARAKSLLTRLFSFIKQLRAVHWVATFVGTRLKALPGSESFVAHIRQQGGVRRDELIDFLIEQRLTGISAETLGSGANKSFGQYQIADVAGAIRGRLSSVLGSSVSDSDIGALLAFCDARCLHVPPGQRRHAEQFVVKFQQFADSHPNHPLAALLQGKVNLLSARLRDDSDYARQCRDFLKQLPSIPGRVQSLQSKIAGWPDFLLAVSAGAEGKTEFDERGEGLFPVEYGDHFSGKVESRDPVTQGPDWPNSDWQATVDTVYRRYLLRESRSELAEVSLTLDLALARRPDDDASKALKAFFFYCARGPACITRHSMERLKAVTSESVQQFCKVAFSGHPDAEHIAVWADNLFVQLQQDLSVFDEGASSSVETAPRTEH